eukprot:4137446-Amphidinium_carterae.1
MTVAGPSQDGKTGLPTRLGRRRKVSLNRGSMQLSRVHVEAIGGQQRYPNLLLLHRVLLPRGQQR